MTSVSTRAARLTRWLGCSPRSSRSVTPPGRWWAGWPRTAESSRSRRPWGVRQFLGGAPAFWVRHTHIDRFVADMAAERRAAGRDQAQVIADLKTLQRAYKLTPRFAQVKAMLAAGHTSAYSVYTTGRERFAEQMTAAGATPADADTIFNQADQVHATTLALLGNFNSAFTSVTPSAVAQPLPQAAVQSLLASFPLAAVAVRRQRLLRLRALSSRPRSGGLPRRRPAVPQVSSGRGGVSPRRPARASS